MNDKELIKRLLEEAGVSKEELEKAKQQAIKDIKKETEDGNKKTTGEKRD